MRIVIELSNWLINAFNGEWIKVNNAKSSNIMKRSAEKMRGAVRDCVECGGS